MCKVTANACYLFLYVASSFGLLIDRSLDAFGESLERVIWSSNHDDSPVVDVRPNA